MERPEIISGKYGKSRPKMVRAAFSGSEDPPQGLGYGTRRPRPARPGLDDRPEPDEGEAGTGRGAGVNGEAMDRWEEKVLNEAYVYPGEGNASGRRADSREAIPRVRGMPDERAVRDREIIAKKRAEARLYGNPLKEILKAKRMREKREMKPEMQEQPCEGGARPEKGPEPSAAAYPGLGHFNYTIQHRTGMSYLLKEVDINEYQKKEEGPVKPPGHLSAESAAKGGGFQDYNKKMEVARDDMKSIQEGRDIVKKLKEGREAAGY